MNKYITIANLTQDPEAKEIAGKDAVILNVAVNDGYGEKKRVVYLRGIAFNKTAEACLAYLQKGSKVCLEASLSMNNWEKEVGGEVVKMRDYSLFINRVEFLSSKGEEATSSGSTAKESSAPAKSNSDVDDDIPF